MEYDVDSKKVEYKLAVVTFIDILGFKNIISERTANDVSDIIRLFKFASKCNQEKNKYLRNTYSFSDSIVRVYYHDEWNTTETAAIIDEVCSISEMQEMLLIEGVLIRGGLTLGYVYTNNKENIIFGPAVNKAYYLESQKARDPRIVIDPDLLIRLQSENGSFENLINIDEHGLPWIRGCLRMHSHEFHASQIIMQPS